MSIKIINHYKLLCEFNEIYHNCLIQVCSQSFGMDIKRLLVHIRTDDEFSGDISGIIPISTPHIEGSLAVSFSKTSYLPLVNYLLEKNYDDIDENNRDIIIDICSDIYVSSLAPLKALGMIPSSTFPMAVIGQNHRIKHTIKEHIIVSEYESNFGVLKLESVAKEL